MQKYGVYIQTGYTRLVSVKWLPVTWITARIMHSEINKPWEIYFVFVRSRALAECKIYASLGCCEQRNEPKRGTWNRRWARWEISHSHSCGERQKSGRMGTCREASTATLTNDNMRRTWLEVLTSGGDETETAKPHRGRRMPIRTSYYPINRNSRKSRV